MTPRFESRAADWLSVDEALARILADVTPLVPERVPLSAALGRALAEPIVADATLPPWDNSAMDGYAVRADDVLGATEANPVELRVGRHVRAGDPAGAALRPGEAVRIMTGAPVPGGADSVVRVEDTDRESRPGAVLILDDRDAGKNVRPAGQDMRPGELLLEGGDLVTPGAVGVLAAAGRAEVLVYRQPSVAVLTTGNELRGPDRFEDVRNGTGVPDSNGPMLAAMSAEAGAIPLLIGTASDDEADLRRRIDEGADADALVTVGGASMGDADLVKRVLDDMGYRPGFWRVRMRPGSPVGFGWLPRGDRRQPVFGLPGNPTSAFVTFEVLVRPHLQRLAGYRHISRRTIVCRAAEPIRAPAKLTYFLRVQIEGSGEAASARLTGPQGSGLVSGLGRARGLAVLPEDVTEIAVGGHVDVILTGGP